MNKLLLLPLLCVVSLQGMEIDSVYAEKVRVLSHKNHMYVEDENAAYRVENHHMSQDLRRLIANQALAKFKADKAGYVRVSKDSEGKYMLAAKVRGLGGTGPITAGVVNMVTRVSLWTGFLLAASTPVIAGTAVGGPAGATAAGTAVTSAIAASGGTVAVAAGIEAAAMKATLWTLLLPIPLP